VSTPLSIRWLFADPRAAWVWFPLRLYVGWSWFNAGRHKIWPDEGDSWIESSAALEGYWRRAVGESGESPIVYGWYRDFIQYMLDNEWYEWFAPLVAIGEFAVGVALILGAFVGVAAFFGALMNFNFMLAGSASTNPVLFALAIGLVLAWRVAGIIGLDRWLLPVVRTPWNWAAAEASRRQERAVG
jgi:thiosulfate dehydrogenase [quinone] large subunit